MYRKCPGNFRETRDAQEIVRNIPGNAQDISTLGIVQDISGYVLGNVLQNSDKCPGYFREISGQYVLPSLPRLKKSGIEYVILAGSSFFCVARCQFVRSLPALDPLLARAARDFSKDLTFWVLNR